MALDLVPGGKLQRSFLHILQIKGPGQGSQPGVAPPTPPHPLALNRLSASQGYGIFTVKFQQAWAVYDPKVIYPELGDAAR